MKSKVIKRCSDCGRFLSEDDFYYRICYRTKTKDKRCFCCKRCSLNKTYLWRLDNKEYNKQHYENNKDIRKKYIKKWQKENKEYLKEYQKNWVEENKDKHNQYVMKRNALKKKQAPKLTDLEHQKIDLYYSICKEMGNNFEVDHIKPLSRGGLHHPDNLQILSRKLNREKKDRYPLTKEEKVKFNGIIL